MNLLLSIIGQRRRVFNPLSLSPALWLDASDDATLFDATSGGSLPTNGNDIARWGDKSGNGRHATQSVASACPHRQASAQNGLGVVRFDGSNDGMDLPSGFPTGNTARSVFCVSKITVASGVQTVFSYGNTGTRQRYNLRFNNAVLNGEFASAVLQTGNIGSPTNFKILGILHAGGNASTGSLRVNGVSQNTTFSFNDGALDTADANASIGYRRNPIDSYLGGDIAEILVFPVALSADEINQVESYLSTKWGI